MIPLVKVAMPDAKDLMPQLQEVLYSGMIAEGEAVYQFEREFARCFSLNNVAAMSSGTAALHAALTLAGVSAGDEVVSTSMTAEPTNTSILYCGARVVWADVDCATGNIDPNSVREKITERTKAIICVHYAGYPSRLKELRSLADEFGIPLIEDCAHALGATYLGNSVGTVGDFSIFSFQAIKHMTTVDGGMLVIKDNKHIETAKKFRWFGMLKGVPRTEIDVSSVGHKYNMNNVTATIGLVQLRGIFSLIKRHVQNGQYFDEQFARIPGLSFAKCEPCGSSSYWIYTLLSDNALDVQSCLEASGVSASKLHRPNHLHTVFRSSRRDLPATDVFYNRLVHIPCGWWIDSEQRDRIVSVLSRG